MNREVHEPADQAVGASGGVAGAASGESSHWLFSRRQVLGGSVGIGVGSLLVKYDPALHEPDQLRNVIINDDPHAVVIVTPAQPTVHFTLERPEDMVVLDITFYGFTLEKGTTYPSVKATTAKTISNWIGAIVQFPPQSIGEGDYAYDKLLTIPFDPSPIVSQTAGPSRLCYTMATGTTIPLKTGAVADLLDWTGWTLSTARGATIGSAAQSPAPPAVYETSIEVPLALMLSPVRYPNTVTTKGIVYTRFAGRAQPFTSPAKVTELWTANLLATYEILTAQGLLVSQLKPAIAAVWCTDYFDATADATPETNIQYDEYIFIA
jgi:hypothetical protein